MGHALTRRMPTDPKRDAQKTEDAGLVAEPVDAPSVAKPDAPGEERIETAVEKNRQLDRETLEVPSSAP
jgi:hypothetical protein